MNHPIAERLLPVVYPTEFILFKPVVSHQHFPRKRRFPHLFAHAFEVHAEADVEAWLTGNGSQGVDYRLAFQGRFRQVWATDDFALAFRIRWC